MESTRKANLLAELKDEVMLLDFGMGFALCHRDFGGARGGIQKAQEHFVKVQALLKELDLI